MKTLLLYILVLLPLISMAQLSGKVVGVADGDTFTILTSEKEQVKVRLHGIDCPEKSQDFGQVAKQFLSELVFNKIVSVKELDIDRYGRTIGIVTVDSVIVNEALLSAGLAWHYKKYDKSELYANLESNARANKKGLWVRRDAIAPWEYRRIN